MIEVTFTEAPATVELEQQWRGLEAHSDTTFFTSWSWTGNWLRGLDPEAHPQLLRATVGGQVVGLGLFVWHRRRRLKLLPSSSLYLHATGQHKHDDVRIEHNGLLCSRERPMEIQAAMFSHLLAIPEVWDRIYLPGLSSIPHLLPHPGIVLRQQVDPSYFVDLKAVRERKGDYLALLSSNTRAQIRRSMTAFQALGAVTATPAPDVPTALRYLERLKALHQHRWTGRGDAGAFANPLFESFHSRLITDGLPRGEVQMLRVHVAERDIGYLYSFVYRGRVLVYQSGFDYSLLQKRNRPGLVAHSMGIQLNARLGHDTYDFLAGHLRYKQSLSTGTQSMVWMCMHRDTLAFRIEDALLRVGRKVVRGVEDVFSRAEI